MSKLEQLISELCPNGVNYVHLWEVTIWDKRFNSVDREKQKQIITYPYLLASNLFNLEQPTGNVFLLSTGEKTGWTNEELAGNHLCQGEVVAIPWGKSRPLREIIKYYKGKFVTADNRIATSNDTDKLLNKYLYYCMINQGEIIDEFYRGSGIKHPNMNDVLNVMIPLPPLPVQEEIVRILDKFAELTAELAAELTAELTARKQQYEYYRDALLTSGDNIKLVTLGNVGRVAMCKRIMKNQTTSTGNIPFYKIGTFGKKPDAFISNKLFNEYKEKYSFPTIGSILISAAGTIGRTVVYDGNPAYYQDSNIVWLEHDESAVLNKYLYYCYQLKPWNISDGGTISRLYNDNILKAKIPVPYPGNKEKSLAEQQRIVDILDRFDRLCNDISEGLPAEIEARQKQYEYYRDKLLTFKKKEAAENE